MKHTGMFSMLLKNVYVALKFQKYAFFTKANDNLMYIIRAGRLEFVNHISDAPQERKTSTKVPGIRSVLGLCNVLRRFVPNFASIASPLRWHLKKKEKRLKPLEEDEF